LRRGDDLAEAASLNAVLLRADCDGTAREQLVRLMIRQGRIEEALPPIERLQAAEPATAPTWFSRCWRCSSPNAMRKVWPSSLS